MSWKDLVAKRFNQQEGFAVGADKKEAKNSEGFGSGEAKKTVASDYDKPLRFVPSKGSAESAKNEPVDKSAVASPPKKIESEREVHTDGDLGVASTEPNPVAESDTEVKEPDQTSTEKRPESGERANTTLVDMETIKPDGSVEGVQTSDLKVGTDFDTKAITASNAERAKDVLFKSNPPKTSSVGGEAGVVLDQINTSSSIEDANAQRVKAAINEVGRTVIASDKKAEREMASEIPKTGETNAILNEVKTSGPEDGNYARAREVVGDAVSEGEIEDPVVPLPIEPKTDESDVVNEVADKTLNSAKTEEADKDLSTDALPPILNDIRSTQTKPKETTSSSIDIQQDEPTQPISGAIKTEVQPEPVKKTIESEISTEEFLQSQQEETSTSVQQHSQATEILTKNVPDNDQTAKTTGSKPKNWFARLLSGGKEHQEVKAAGKGPNDASQFWRAEGGAADGEEAKKAA